MHFVDGPSFSVLGPTKRYALLNESLSLVCGNDLQSRPHPTIAWTAPDGTMIWFDNARYNLQNGPNAVRLNFTHTTVSDGGIWTCNIRTVSVRDIVLSDGNIIREDRALIGVPLQHTIKLTVIGECTFLSRQLIRIERL